MGWPFSWIRNSSKSEFYFSSSLASLVIFSLPIVQEFDLPGIRGKEATAREIRHARQEANLGRIRPHQDRHLQRQEEFLRS